MKKRTLLTGFGLGVIAGLLFAPKKGSELREDLKEKLEELKEYAKDFSVDEAKEKFLTKCDDLLFALEELDKEAILEAAKEKIELIRVKTEELYDFAINEGTPIAKEKFYEIKDLVLKTTENALAKLKKEEN